MLCGIIKLEPLFSQFRHTLSKASADARSVENHSFKLTLFSSEDSVFCSLAHARGTWRLMNDVA